MRAGKMPKKPNPPSQAPRPDVFRYRDPTRYLADWVAWKKASDPAFSLRELASEARVATGHLPMILSGSRRLTHKAFQKLAPSLGLRKNERAYFEILLQLDQAESPDARVEALERLKRFADYREKNPREVAVTEYLTRWHAVAIREMSALPGFRAEAEWVMQRLRASPPQADVAAALEFLLKNGLIPPEKELDCEGDVYRIALIQLHRQMLEQAAASLEHTPSDERRVLAHTVALAPDQITEAKRIVEDALARMRALSQKPSQSPPEAVYHLELALFPLTRQPKE